MSDMIKNVIIRNFKSVKEMEMACSNLNLLIGTNSCGKSTILQALLFLVQNMEESSGLNGELVKLGDFKENCCSYSQEKEIVVLMQDEKTSFVRKALCQDADSNKLRIITVINADSNIDEWKNTLAIKHRAFQYLSCHRIGPANLYRKNMALDDVIGTNGEYAISYLNSHAGDVVSEELRKGFSDFTLLGQVNWWLKYIADTEISTEEIPGADMIKASYRMGELTKIRPVNIGAGISYLVSILIMCLSAPEKGIIVIENPEIHLHPSAQSKVCEFLYYIANNNRQLFIESHSDHIFNGFRAGLARSQMDKEKINIQFVSLNKEHVSEAMKVEVGKYGNIVNQREDLFDQFDIDMNRMIGI